jgi:hypothetical protein
MEYLEQPWTQLLAGPELRGGPMTLTPLQLQLLSSEDAAPLTIDGTPCAILLQEVFEK